MPAPGRVLIGAGLVMALASPTPGGAAPRSLEGGRFTCPPSGGGRIPGSDATAILSAALDRSAERVDGASRLDTPMVPGYAGIVVGVVGDAEGDSAGREAAIVPLLRCGDSACAGAPLRFRGAKAIRVRAVIDLAGYDGDVQVGEGGGGRGPMPRGCPRRPALIVEVVDGPEHGSDRLVMIVTMASGELRVIHSERSHVGPEGGSTVIALRFRGTRGGSPSDLVVLHRRHAAKTGGSAGVDEVLYNYVDGRYRSAP